MLIMKTLKKQEIFKCIINQFYLQLKKKIGIPIVCQESLETVREDSTIVLLRSKHSLLFALRYKPKVCLSLNPSKKYCLSVLASVNALIIVPESFGDKLYSKGCPSATYE